MQDLTGQRFGRWTVIRFSHTTQYRENYWYCRCDCGNENAVRCSHLTKALSQSCGCFQRECVAQQSYKHGLTQHPIYGTYHQMKNRCYNPNDSRYRDYGGRGITICSKWRYSVVNFLDDMGERPPGTTLDRIDNDGPYSPENCRWATSYQQGSNTRKNHWLEHDGQRLTVAQWARRLNVNQSTIYSRLRYGWSISDALTRPIDTRCHHHS